MSFLELAKERYSCRNLSDKPIAQDKIDKIILAARLAPTAVNKQPYKIWIMQSEDAQNAISSVTNYTFGAKLFFVIGGKKDEAWVRKYDNANFVHVDASIVATQMMLEIQELGLGTTWVGSFDAPKLQNLYPEMKEYDLIAIFPVGYPTDDAKPSDRHASRKSVQEVAKVL